MLITLKYIYLKEANRGFIMRITLCTSIQLHQKQFESAVFHQAKENNNAGGGFSLAVTYCCHTQK